MSPIGQSGRPGQSATSEGRYLPEFDIVRAGQQRLDGPFGQFAAVIFQFRGDHGPLLAVQLLSPVHTARELKPSRHGLNSRRNSNSRQNHTFESHSLNALMVRNSRWPWAFIVNPSCSVRQIRNSGSLPSGFRFHFRYLNIQSASTVEFSSYY